MANPRTDCRTHAEKTVLVDAHCHILHPLFDKDREEVIQAALTDGVIVVACALGEEEAEKAALIAANYPNVRWTLGVEPTQLDEKRIIAFESALRKHHTEILAVGEIGLDHYWTKKKEEHAKQEENFRRFLSIAEELKRPVVIHSRDAEEDCVRIVGEYGVSALYHCFSGTVEQADRIVCRGDLISIPCSVAYSKSKQDLAAHVPLENIVLETDAPFLAPTPKTRNEPKNVSVAAQKIAEIKGITFENTAKATTKNALRFFNNGV
ncbi:Tat-linked quality control protein TatD [uncultured archaeon]|nr:Tat-linked quality control protein TatD [uncultured archaeon]